MAKPVGSVRFGMLLVSSALGAFVACGGDDAGAPGANAGRGGSGLGEAGTGNEAGSGSEQGPGFPTRLPSGAADCSSASGGEGCYFDGCCTELVACSENPACATAYGCYVSCPESSSDCFPNCAGSSLEAGAEDFGNALGCLAPLMLSCGNAGGGPDGGVDGGTEPPTGPLGSASDALGWDLNVSDDPLVAELELETDAAVSEVVTVDGGTITATAADGTTFELSVPEGALYGPTVITLTPFASLSVPPLEGPAFGVQIEPDGLSLMGSPRLRITPPDGEMWPVDQQIPLAITGGNQTVSLAPVDPAVEPLELVLTHFSGYGALLSQKGIGATLTEAQIRSRFGGDAAERLQSAAAERLGVQRMHELLGTGTGIDDIGGLVGELAPEFEKYVLNPRIAKAGESCAAGKLAMQTLLGYTRQLQLLGVGDDPGAFIGLIPVVAEVCLKEEYELCRDNHIITRVLPILMSFNRQAQLLGLSMEVEGVSIPPAWLVQAEENVKKCLKFELRFDSDVLYSDDSPATSMTETVSAQVPAELNASFTTLPISVLPDGAAEIGALILGGPAPLESSSYSVGTQERCRTIDSQMPAAGELYVSFLSFIPGITTEETPGGSPEVLDFSISIALSPNLSSYVFTQQREESAGCREVTANGEDILSWSTTLGAYMLTTYTSETQGVLFDAWEVQKDGGQILAVKDLALSGSDEAQGQTYRGPVNMVLLHAPDP